MIIDENWIYPKDSCLLKLQMEQTEKSKIYAEKGG